MRAWSVIARRPPAVPRSPKWRRLERWWLADRQPTCQACGGRLFRQVHHVVPFHVHPDLELDPANLMTLCMRPLRSCHLRIGHGGDWRSTNPNVRADAALALLQRKGRSA